MSPVAVVELWAAATAPAIGVLPIVARLFPRLPDGGWSLARPIGLVAWAWPAWLLASTSPLPYGDAMVFSVLAVMVAGGTWLALRSRADLRPRLRQGLVSEAVFIVVLLLAVGVMPMNGELHPMAERFMDYAFFKRISVGHGFPPLDPWMAGRTLPYYYFGFVLMDLVRRAAAASVAGFFDYAVALCYALFAAAAYGVGLAIWRRRGPALVAAAVVLLSGNLHVLVDAVAHGRLTNVDWYGSARVVAGAITEFPLFSFVHGDLHAYTMAFPIVATVLALAVSVAGERAPPRRRLAQVFVIVLVAGVLMPLHAWDFVTFGGLAAAAVAWSAYRPPARSGVARSVAIFVVTLGASVLCYLPFVLTTLTGQHGRGIAISHLRTRTGPFLVMWAPLIAPVILWLVFASSRRRTRWLGLATVPVVAIALLVEAYVPVHLALVLPLCLVVALVLDGCIDSAKPADVCRILAIVGLLAVLSVELLYAKDLRRGAAARMTTVFKVYVQAWILLGIAAAGLAYDLIVRERGRWRWLARVSIALSGAAAATFLVLGVPAAEHDILSSVGGPRTMNALTLFDLRAPGDAAAAGWIEANLPIDAVVLEAPTYAHAWPGRMATVTGRPTLVGWIAHEALWRNNWRLPLKRRRDALRIYRTPDASEAASLARADHVAYVYVGAEELRAFGPPSAPALSKFESWPVAYQNPAARLYRVPGADAAGSLRRAPAWATTKER